MEPILDATNLQEALQATFPGTEILDSPRIGGRVLEAVVWYFHVEASVTTDLVALRDTTGETMLSFVFRPPNMRATIILQEKTISLTRVQTWVKEIGQYLDGIEAAIAVVRRPSENKEPDVWGIS